MNSIGRYRLERRIGAGSFATVWLGHDDDLDVPVAVKVLADNWAGNSDVRQRFLTEARIMRRIRDRRIVQVYDIGTLDDGRPYFVMDFIDGGSLDDLRKQPLPPGRALRLCAEACRALEVLHCHDIIHRDVTPGNLLLASAARGESQVLIADLGVAKSMMDLAGATLTAGTPSYMALEQALGVGPLDRRADIYSLTALTYAMLTGRPPFVVRSLADLLARDPALEPAPIAGALGAPPILDALLVSGLASDPNRRPPTADILARALDGIADQMMDAAGRARPGSDATLRSPVLSPSTVVEPIPHSTGPVSYGDQYGPGPETGPAPGSPPAYASVAHVEAAAVEPLPDVGSVEPANRSASFFVLVVVAALALFALSFFITIVVIRR